MNNTQPEQLAANSLVEGIALHRQGDLEAAIAHYRQALTLYPQYPDALYNLSVAFSQQGKFEAAIACCQQVIHLHPDHAAAYYTMGSALCQQQHIDAGIACYQKAIDINPTYAKASCNLGSAYTDQNREAEAIACYQKAIDINPNFAEAYCNLGAAQLEQGLVEAAIASCRMAIELKPEYAKAYCNLGNALAKQAKWEEAIAALQKAIAIQPNLAEAYANLGNTLLEKNQIDEAIELYQKALDIEPNLAFTHYSLATALLTQGDYHNGWREYEWRWQMAGIVSPNFTQPLWDGSPFAGQKILIWCEQGFGDTLQFIRYVPLVTKLGGQVIVQCPASLSSLLTSIAGISQLISQDEPLPSFDLYIPLLSLPRVLHTTIATIPNQVPYLKSGQRSAVSGQLEEKADSRKLIANSSLKADSSFKIGIVWASGYRSEFNLHRAYRKKSCPLSMFEHLLSRTEFSFYSLQFGKDAEDIEKLSNRDRLQDLSSQIHDFADTAALIDQLDLVISVDTAVAHLAGAMGKPVWVLLPFMADWRWLLDRVDSPWYPTMRLFRQHQIEDWTSVFVQLEQTLDEYKAKNQVADSLETMHHNSEENQKNSPAQRLAALGIKLKKVSPEAYYDLGNTLFKQHQLEAAVAAYQAAIALNSNYIAAHFNLAVCLRRQGELEQAIANYHTVLQLQPHNAQAYYGLGNIFLDQENWEEAVSNYQSALQINPNHGDTYFNLGLALKRQGKFEESARNYATGIAINPKQAQALLQFGNVLVELKRLDEAINCYQQAITLKPEEIVPYFDLGDIYLLQDKPEEAIRVYQQVITIQPNNYDAYRNIGVVQRKQKDFEAAALSYQKALEVKPDDAITYYSLGNALFDWGKLEEAIAAQQTALALNPNFIESYNSLGDIFLYQDQLEQAIACFQKAIAINPEYAPAYQNLGGVLSEQGQIAAAIAAYEQAIALPTHIPQTHVKYAEVLRLSGNLTTGLAENEWRWQMENYVHASFDQPQWDGSDLHGKRILIWAERGQFLGDTIHFSRYAPLVAKRGGHVIFQCDPPLIDLISQMDGIAEVVDRHNANLPEFDVHAPLMSLPFIFKTTLETIPHQVPYLRSGQRSAVSGQIGKEKADSRKLIADSFLNSSLKIGIVWASGYRASKYFHRFHKQKSCPLALFISLLSISGICLYSLQVGKNAEDIAEFSIDHRFQDLSDQIHDFTDTAALIDQLDLVISVDTAVAHLAGAMGKPVWVLLPFIPEWRWLLGREDSPWYPTMRLFRQPQRGDWKGVFEQVKTALQELSDRHFQAQNIANEQNALGITLGRQGKALEAIAAFEQVIQLNPLHKEAHFNLGLMLHRQNRQEEAITHYQTALSIQPNSLETYINLGVALKQLGKFEEAIATYQQALKIDPNFVDAYSNLSSIFLLQDRLEEVILYCQKSIALNPNFPFAYNNLGAALEKLGRVEEAIAAYRKTVELSPNSARSHFNLAHALMLNGDYAEGLAEYEWRWQAEEVTPPNFSKPLWDGSDLSGRTILLVSEQGLGDTLQFIRYASLLATRAKSGKVRAIAYCPPALASVIATAAGIDAVIPEGDKLPEFDCYIPLISMLKIFGTTLETIPNQVPYLGSGQRSESGHRSSVIGQLEEEEADSRKLIADGSFKIGIVWASGYRPQQGLLKIYQAKSCPLSLFVSLLEISEVCLYSLQVGKDVVAIQEFANQPRLIDLSDRIHDFMDTAALIEQLDLVISVDTSVIHLAGAMAKPVWVLLPQAPDWRWLLEREDSPWYPTMRLFRQPKLGDWESVFMRIREALHELFS